MHKLVRPLDHIYSGARLDHIIFGAVLDHISFGNRRKVREILFDYLIFQLNIWI